jgi:hypothetical protein
MASKVTEISGIGPQTAAVLASHGFKTVESIASADKESLCQVQGFSMARTVKTIDAANALLSGATATASKKKSATTAKAKPVVADKGKDDKTERKIKKLKDKLKKKGLKKKDKKKLKKKLSKLKK